MSRAGEKETGRERTFAQLSGVSSHTRVHIQARSVMQAHKFTLSPGRAHRNVDTSYGPVFSRSSHPRSIKDTWDGLSSELLFVQFLFSPHVCTVYICAAFGSSDYNQDVVHIRN